MTKDIDIGASVPDSVVKGIRFPAKQLRMSEPAKPPFLFWCSLVVSSVHLAELNLA